MHVSTSTLSYCPPYDWTALTTFLAARQIDGVERVGNARYERTFVIEGCEGHVEATHVPDRHCFRVTVRAGDRSVFSGVFSRLRRLLDLDLDPAQVAAHFGGDSLLRPLVAARPGLRVPGAFDPFEISVRAILGQQVTVAGATRLCSRLVHSFGRQSIAAPVASGLTHLFPEPAALAVASVAKIGMPRNRATTINALAEAVDADAQFFEGEPTAVRARLLAIRGIGDWTAQYVSMRALGDRDAFPSGDLGLQRALARGRLRPTTRQMETRSERWRPWRAYAALHLWSA
ncbi:MAG TPA: DNA-3-methyladenine glycosylase [Thermoanaerobaculia bacterium]